MDVVELDRRKAKKLRKKLDRGRGTHDEALAIYGVAACAGVTLMTSGDPATSKRPPPPLQLDAAGVGIVPVYRRSRSISRHHKPGFLE